MGYLFNGGLPAQAAIRLWHTCVPEIFLRQDIGGDLGPVLETSTSVISNTFSPLGLRISRRPEVILEKIENGNAFLRILTLKGQTATFLVCFGFAHRVLFL